MSLKARLTEDMKDAMRAKDKDRLATIRLILAALKQREVDERIELDDTQVLAVLDKMLKQRRESIAQFESAGRTDLAEKEAAEAAIIQTYLPAALSPAELDALIDATITATGAAGVRDMGKVMAAIKAQAQGRADMSEVSARIRTRLGG
ncbi:MAG TPA: GatB/YqeY domain-containing protein [Plasticicumulans sp.]|uniref:GatB/YqeY domain-containing protein n=1 Tax=Plasticicumulans sp. TaxID=2307179 RepID=UPI002BED836E|nr:GatB/YqeY domain-containing protein [Plasticicumulans sp.]HMV39430.1 GatB/YqeY domain-containing protein [Plasticicumulans sp.]HMW30853.1 GatB/YqeY domain-containing protein [Plasticicumulans sp.]HMW42626.1 GatB/YqeY domain-containing protein [Plasticicumulans sp.]HNE01037.1 GatB/YqeY domain-containing protein [Plasticicumulans sp.]HNF66339.1 GatB/YqeY domain-containing protein [Plasticicumulans sp.]